jgi:hypothetical protein
MDISLLALMGWIISKAIRPKHKWSEKGLGGLFDV